MEKLRDKRAPLLYLSFALATLFICLLAVFPKHYFIFNIMIVILLVYNHMIYYRLGLKLQAVLVGLFAVTEVVLTRDVARISIFVFYLFLCTECLYEKTAVRRYTQIAAICFCTVLLAYLLVGFNRQYDRLSWDFYRQGFFEEKALGFTNPNRCMLQGFCLSALVLLQTDKVRHYLEILLVNLVLYQFTQSRTYFYVIVMIVFGLLVLKLLRRENTCSFLSKNAAAVFFVLLALSVILPAYFSDTVLNAIFTRRLVHNKVFLQTGITLLGNSLLESATFDSSYLHMLLAKGVLFLAVFSILLVWRCRHAEITNKKAIILLAIFLACFMEVMFLEYSVMYLIGLLLSTPRRKELPDAQ